MARRVPRMSEAESAAWLNLVTVLELLPPALDAQLRRDSDLTHFEFVVLSVLRFAPDQALRMSVLASHVAATAPRLSHVVTRLEGRGLVERQPVENDRRGAEVTLTSEGRRILVLATPGHVERVRRLVFDVLEPEQIAQLEDIAGRIARGLDPTDRFGGGATH